MPSAKKGRKKNGTWCFMGSFREPMEHTIMSEDGYERGQPVKVKSAERYAASVSLDTPSNITKKLDEVGWDEF